MRSPTVSSPSTLALLAFASLSSLSDGCASHPAHPVAAGPSGPTMAAPAVQAPAASEAYDDPGELRDPETMAPLFSRDTRPSFPKATASDRDCWRSVLLSGEARRDYEALVARCGSPTGSVQYVAPVVGKLHSAHDRRDTFAVKVQGGLCYRFFGVADGSIQDLDILIERANGDLVGEDKTNGPVAIIEPDKTWCMENDGDLRFHVQIDGQGTGNYEFGVWARPTNSRKTVAVR